MADNDRIEGAAKNMGGKIKEGVGNVTGDEKLKAEGKAEQVEGKVQNTIGGIKERAASRSPPPVARAYRTGPDRRRRRPA